MCGLFCSAGSHEGIQTHHAMLRSHAHSVALPVVAQVIRLVGWPKPAVFLFLFNFCWVQVVPEVYAARTIVPVPYLFQAAVD